MVTFSVSDEQGVQRLACLEGQLVDLERRYVSARSALDTLTEDAIRSGEKLDTVIRIVRDLDQEHRDANPDLYGGLDAAFEEVCEIYLVAGEGVRDRVRLFFGNHFSLLSCLVGQIGRAAQALREQQDPKWLEIGLAAASIEDNRIDFRDTYVALGDLYLAAARAGLSPTNYFKRVATSSSSATGEFLAGFDRSAYFAESIAPNL